jgi:hypothetical protein
LYKRQGVIRDFRDKLNALLLGCVINTALEDAATVPVGGNFDTVDGDGIINELVVRGNEAVQALLDDVVAVEVLDEGHDMRREGSDNGNNLVVVSRISLK